MCKTIASSYPCSSYTRNEENVNHCAKPIVKTGIAWWKEVYIVVFRNVSPQR